MKNTHYQYLIIFLGVVFIADFALAGAWLRASGETYAKVSVSQFESDEQFGPKGNTKMPGPDFKDWTSSFYAEYGLSQNWTGILSLSHKSLSSEMNGIRNTETGLSDAWFYLKRRIVEKKFVVSGQVGVKVPLGYDELNNPPLGDGQIDLDTRVLIGKSFYPFPGYGNFEVAYRKRNGDFSDNIQYLLEAGANIHKKVLLKLNYKVVDSRANDTASKGNKQFLASNVFDQEMSTLMPALIFFLPKGYSIDVYYETVLTGGNTAAGRTIGIGLAWQG